MLNFFSMIGEFLQVGWNYLVNLFQSLISAIYYLTSASSTALTILTYMPAIISAVGISVIAIGTIKFLIGR